VYLGAPVATPLDPRHRLVTTKYNPARTWTPENAVGIGGAYLCIYGMEGPGGYQFVGRTVPIWNTWKTSAAFQPGTPWLLRFFDIIRWYEVPEDDLPGLRDAMRAGTWSPKIEAGSFSWKQYREFLTTNADPIAAFRAAQRQAFSEERARWDAAKQVLP
jgi:urea carboxylase